MPETLRRSSLGGLSEGDRVNLELPLRASDRLGGHIVQGHVDGVAERGVRRGGNARVVRVRAAPELLRYVVAKGSIAVDGVSLTVADVDDEGFSISLIPETLERTNLGALGPGDSVNLEVDVVAKYVEKLARACMTDAPFSPIEDALEDMRAGKMVVVCDAEDRENEGDLTLAAQFATPEAINFMAKDGRGLICLALTPERCDELGLDLMAAKNESPFRRRSRSRSRPARGSPPASPHTTAPARSRSPSIRSRYPTTSSSRATSSR